MATVREINTLSQQRVENETKFRRRHRYSKQRYHLDRLTFTEPFTQWQNAHSKCMWIIDHTMGFQTGLHTLTGIRIIQNVFSDPNRASLEINDH